MSSGPAWKIELLQRAHLRDDFDCGEAPLDAFLKQFARQNQDRGINKTYVALKVGHPTPRVFGYYTLLAHSLEASRLPPAMARHLPRYPLPVIHLARLAVDRRVQGQGLGGVLLADALKKAALASDIVGVFALEVLAKTPEAGRFYAKYGFVPIPEDPLHWVLPLATVRPHVSR